MTRQSNRFDDRLTEQLPRREGQMESEIGSLNFDDFVLLYLVEIECYFHRRFSVEHQ